jgi:hypothetical protein
MTRKPTQANPDLADHTRCAMYTPGHQVHFIQAKLSWEGDPLKYRSGTLVSVEDDGWITVEVDGAEVCVWNHEPARARHRIEAADGLVVLREPHVLATPTANGNALFSISDAVTACVPPSAEADNSPAGLHKQVLTHGGFMISGIEAVRHLRDDDATDNNGPDAKRLRRSDTVPR